MMLTLAAVLPNVWAIVFVVGATFHGADQLLLWMAAADLSGYSHHLRQLFSSPSNGPLAPFPLRARLENLVLEATEKVGTWF